MDLNIAGMPIYHPNNKYQKDFRNSNYIGVA